MNHNYPPYYLTNIPRELDGARALWPTANPGDALLSPGNRRKKYPDESGPFLDGPWFQPRPGKTPWRVYKLRRWVRDPEGLPVLWDFAYYFQPT